MEKVAIITAASRGMGAAISRRLSADGYNCVLFARSKEVLSLADEIGAKCFMGTVESKDDLKNLTDFTIKECGRIDVVVNNTGHAAKGDLLAISDLEWQAGFELLFMNVVRMSTIITPLFEKQGSGSFINISSFAALEPSLDFPISSAVRASLAAYAKLYATRYGNMGIRMNNVLPGFMDSYPVSDEILNRIPAGRAGYVDEIAGIVSFLASDDSSYINGENIKVDGGLSKSI